MYIIYVNWVLQALIKTGTNFVILQTLFRLAKPTESKQKWSQRRKSPVAHFPAVRLSHHLFPNYPMIAWYTYFRCCRLQTESEYEGVNKLRFFALLFWISSYIWNFFRSVQPLVPPEFIILELLQNSHSGSERLGVWLQISYKDQSSYAQRCLESLWQLCHLYRLFKIYVWMGFTEKHKRQQEFIWGIQKVMPKSDNSPYF